MVMFVHLTPKKNLKAVMPSESHEGCEVIIGRKITSGEIRHVGHLPQVIGGGICPALSSCPPAYVRSITRLERLIRARSSRRGKERQG